MTINDNLPAALRRQAAPGAAPGGSPGRLKLINAGPSADGQLVHLHFVTDANHVTSVQLETSVAVNFYTLLGEVLARTRDPEHNRPRLN